MDIVMYVEVVKICWYFVMVEVKLIVMICLVGLIVYGIRVVVENKYFVELYW